METPRYILETTNKVIVKSRERSEAMVSHGRYINLISPVILASILACPKDVLGAIARKHNIPVVIDPENPDKIVKFELKYFKDLLKAMKEEDIETNRRWLQELDLDSEKPIEVEFPWGKKFKYYIEKSQ